MKLEKIEDLSALFELCQKKGIESFKITGETVEFKMKENWQPKKRKRLSLDKSELADAGLSEEQALFWSSHPVGN